MKIIKIVFFVLVAIVAAIFTTSFFTPKSLDMQRSVTVNASQDVIYQYLSDFKNMNQWSPWYNIDPNTQYEYFGAVGEAGHGYNWKSDNKDVGTGKMIYTSFDQPKQLNYQLDFVEPFESNANGAFVLEDQGGNTKVSWTFHTEFGRIESVIMLFVDLEGMLEKDFDKGLKKLSELNFNSEPVLN